MSVAAVVTDLIFATKITSTAQSLGISAELVRSCDHLRERLEEGGVATVLIDLEADGLDAGAAIELCRRQEPRPRIIAFGSHVKKDLLAAARDAGADEVLPRSALSARLPEVLRVGSERD